MLDQYDTLQAACDSTSLYPTNLIRTHTFFHILESYRKRLQENQKSLFGSKSIYHLIEFLEACDGDIGIVHRNSLSLDNSIETDMMK